MANLDQQNQIINLGKLLVNELNLESENDTFSKWMAHYIAEKIIFIENNSGIEKEEANKDCFDTILKLWEYRWSLPEKIRPFNDFDKILKLLENIDPDNDHDFYHRVILNRQYPNLENNIKLSSDWIKTSQEIDRIARILLEYCIDKAVLELDSEKAKKWIKNTMSMTNNEDVVIINLLIDKKEEKIESEKIKKIEKRILELEKFNNISELILTEYKQELSKIKKSH